MGSRMFARPAPDMLRHMQVTISFEGTDPPRGRAGSEGGESMSFTGWLGLLKALSQLLGPLAEPPPPQAGPETTPPAS